MKRFLYILTLFLLFPTCQENILDYDTAMSICEEKRQEAMNSKRKKGIVLIPRNCIVGCQLPDIEAKSLSGKTYNTEQLMGNMNIINFWFIGCPPCIKEIPVLNTLATKYSDRSINFLAIGRDSNKDLNEFLSETEFCFDIISDGRQLIEEKFKLPWGFPTTMVTDTNNIIIAMFATIDEKILSKKIEPLILKYSKEK